MVGWPEPVVLEARAPAHLAVARRDQQVKDKDRRRQVKASDRRVLGLAVPAGKVPADQVEWVAAAQWLICSSVGRPFHLVN